MRLIFSVYLLCNSIVCFAQNYYENIYGTWNGNISVNNNKIPIVFHLSKDSLGNSIGKWDSPSQNANNLPINKVTVYGDGIDLDLKIIKGSYFGKFISKDSITGIWKQGNASLPLLIIKTSDTILPTIKILYPNEKEISIISTDGNKIFGTFLSKNNHQKLAIIIAGSGPTDRDGNNPLGVNASSYKLLAHTLDSENIASFRYDKRGIGKSIQGNFNEGNLVFDDYINDAEKIFNYLQDTFGFKNIYFIGHSEGSLIGMIASQKTKAKGYISIAGAGRPIDKILEEQISKEPLPDSLRNEINSILNQLKNGKEVNDVPASLNSLFRKSIQPYMISWLKYNPATEIKKLKCPVLIVQGTCDKQVQIIDAENLHEADKKSTLNIIPMMTHTLKNANANCNDENNKTYTDSSLPLNAQLINDVVKFIKKN